MSIYQTLKNIGAKLDSWQSDLYVLATPQTIKLTQNQPNRTFFRGTDSKLWIELPFAYEPGRVHSCFQAGNILTTLRIFKMGVSGFIILNFP